jgi:glycosyltransferase involved in cell wall biosynthesis
MLDLTIVVINYNYGKYLRRCLESCFVQENYCSLEIILIDDGSTDNSLSLIKKIKKKNFRVFKTKNNGIEKSANLGFKKSKGRFLLRVDADDYLEKNYIKEIWPHLKKNYAFFYSNYFLVNSKGKKIKRKKLPKFNKSEILSRGDFLATGTVYRKEIIKKVGYYNEKTKNCGLENYGLILDLLINKFKGIHINKTLFNHTRHKNNLSLKNKARIKKYGEQLFLIKQLKSYKVNGNHPYL